MSVAVRSAVLWIHEKTAVFVSAIPRRVATGMSMNPSGIVSANAMPLRLGLDSSRSVGIGRSPMISA